jgi:hypothetical protein
MLLDAIIEPVSDLSTNAAQGAVEWLADHSSLARDGWTLTGIRVVVAAFVFVAIAVGVPVLIIAGLWWLAFKILFPVG